MSLCNYLQRRMFMVQGRIACLAVVTVFVFLWSFQPAFSETIEERLQKVEQEIEQKKAAEEKGSSLGEKLSFYGYGELHYNNPVVEGTGFPAGNLPPTLDFHRLVLGWSFLFTDRLSLHAEVEWEHAGGEIELEYAYLEYDINDALHLRAGSLLMPFGPLNEFHEPTNFYSVERPYVQRFIIPTTWQAGGLGLAGQVLGV